MKSSEQDPIVLVAAKRTPIGHFNGYFKETPCPLLGAAALSACLSQSNLSVNHIDEVLMGCVLTAGLGQAPARQAAIFAGLPPSIPCTTVNKMCGSGMKAIMLAHDALLAGSAKIVLAGGMENMSRAPYLLTKGRWGYRLGRGKIEDHLMQDGLEDPYHHQRSMGSFAEECAKTYQFSRAEQDAYALTSLRRAKAAADGQRFSLKLLPVHCNHHENMTAPAVTADEGPLKMNPEKIPLLKPAFAENGTVTAANSSSISDGAATVLLMRASEAKRFHCQPLATILGHATHAQEPEKFTTAPIEAIRKLLHALQWRPEEVDLFEINEAFAVVVLAAFKTLSLNPEQVNVHGGSCVLGHPIGASGARILITLLYALAQRRLKRGIAALCIGGGEATAMAIECHLEI